MDKLEKTAFVVLGMHRSGTSSIAGTLVKLGASAPKTRLPARQDNETGFFESAVFMQLNDEILASAGSKWDDWRAFNPVWFGSPIAAEFEEKASAAIISEFGSSDLIVIKDPRICRMVPFWLKVINRTGYAARIIIPVRSPLEVARSLQVRNEFPTAKGLLLWLRHTLDAEGATRGLPRAVLDWSRFLVDWRLTTALIGERTGVSWPPLSDQSAADIDHFLKLSLRHFIVASDEFSFHPDVNDWVRDAYTAMIALANEGNVGLAKQELDNVKFEFEKGAKIFGRLLVDVELIARQSNGQAAAARAERDVAVAARDRILGQIAEHRQRTESVRAEGRRLLRQ